MSINKKIFQTAIVVFIWGVLAFGMSVIYYWLKNNGYVWDNIYERSDEFQWNTRKIILTIMGLSSLALAIVRVIIIWDKNAIK